MKCDRHAHVT